MKFNKSSLLSSLAAAGMVLGALAPVVAQAAGTARDDTTFTQDSSKLMLQNDGTAATLAAADNPAYKNQTLADDFAYAANATVTDNYSGSTSGVSDAVIKINSGFLTLNKVPDFNFGTAAAGETAKLVNNSGAIADDGNAGYVDKNGVTHDGVLSITDARETAAGKYDGTGYTLTVGLGQFYKLNANGDARDKDAVANGAWKLSLPNIAGAAITKAVDNAFTFTGATVAAVANGGAGTQVAQAVKTDTNKTYGTVSVDMGPSVGGITLSTPQDDTLSGAYDAPIYWVLTAQPKAATPGA